MKSNLYLVREKEEEGINYYCRQRERKSTSTKKIRNLKFEENDRGKYKNNNSDSVIRKKRLSYKKNSKSKIRKKYK